MKKLSRKILQAVINYNEADQPLDEGHYPTRTQNTPLHLDGYVFEY